MPTVARIVLPTISNVPPFQKLDLYQGSTFIVPYAFYEEDDDTPLDITGYQFAAQIRKKPSDSIVYLAPVPVIDNAVLGRMHLLFLGSAIAAIPCGDLPTSPRSKYVWDFQSISPSGNEEALRRGDVVVWAQVTR